MDSPAPHAVLDEILAFQFTVAWSGEANCEPKRLGWWRTDLVDTGGGGDLLRRLLPRTHRWASLEAVREVARRTDAGARAGMPDPDALRTLFHLGFELNERLDERLAELKQTGADPQELLPFLVDLRAPFSPAGLAQALHPPTSRADFTVVPGGRRVKGAMPTAPALLVKHLAAALVPFAASYPLSFYEMA